MGTETKNPAALLIKTIGIEGMAENIQAIIIEAGTLAPDLSDAGEKWYRTSQQIAIEHTGLDQVRACGIVAALSPQTSWAENVRNAALLVSTREAPTFGPSVKKALSILDGANPLDVLGGNKVRSFYVNLCDPENDKFVTVDRHAVNIALAGIVSGSAKALELSGVYDMVAAAYTVVAEGFHMIPNQCQAISWLAHRSIHAPAYLAADPEMVA